MWRVKVRSGPRVEKHRAETREAALDLAMREARVIANGPRRGTVATLTGDYDPRQQVAGRIELTGPGVRAGIDVRGDGDAEAWTGRVRRRVVAPEEGETPYDAFRRAVAQSASVDP